MRLWDLASPQLPVVLDGHMDAVFDVSCCPSEANLLASCGRKGTLMLWDVRARGGGTAVSGEGWEECIASFPVPILLYQGALDKCHQCMLKYFNKKSDISPSLTPSSSFPHSPLADASEGLEGNTHRLLLSQWQSDCHWQQSL